jgi:hypothetical protein
MFSSKGNQYLLFILAALLIYSCSESTESDNSITELIPLKIGNKWNYEYTAYDSTGTVNFQGNSTSSVDRDTMINSVSWYGYGVDFSGVWNINKSDGYWVFVKAESNYFMNDSSWIVYKFPTNVGDVYRSQEYPVEVLSVDEWISVPAGNFKTIHITQDFSKLNNSFQISSETYICPGIGVVKISQIGRKHDGTKYIVGKSELESYSLK